MSMFDKPIVIIGSGIGGLAAAFAAYKNGATVALIEYVYERSFLTCTKLTFKFHIQSHMHIKSGEVISNIGKYRSKEKKRQKIYIIIFYFRKGMY
jgi:flavin-dependent dehydrogenase